MAGPSLDKDAFYRRMKRLYQFWKDEEQSESLGKADAVGTCLGPDQDVVYSKSSSLQVWLFGYELVDTILLLTEAAVYILASKKKIEFLRNIESSKENENGIPPVMLLQRDKNDKDKQNMEKLQDAIKNSNKGKTIGLFPKDKYTGELYGAWKATIEDGDFEQVDVSVSLALLLSVKEENEIECIKKASQCTCTILNKYLKEQLMEIIDDEKKVRHNKLSAAVEDSLQDKKVIQSSADSDNLEMCYPPIIQSGGSYQLKFSVQSDKNFVHYGVILCSLGCRYKLYCSNVVRTFMVDPPQALQDNYDFLLLLEDLVIDKLRDGIVLGELFTDVISKIKEDKPALESKFTKNLGFGTGIEFREASLLINARSEVVAKKGMVFNVSLGFADVSNKEAKDDQSKKYSLFVGDTVLVNEDEPATILTPSKKKIKHIGVFLKNEEDDADEVEEEEAEDLMEQLGRGKRSAVLENKLRNEQTSEDKRKDKQGHLFTKLHDEAKKRLMENKKETSETKVRKSTVSYKKPSDLPRDPDVKGLRIFVDKLHETVILPVFGVPSPFHISMIKNISQSIEGEYTYLRINFFHPGATIRAEGNTGFQNPEANFLKELTYRATNHKEVGGSLAPASNLNTAFRLIKEVQRRFKTREAEEKELAGVIQQDKLQISTNRGNPKLKDLYVKPNISTKRVQGTLEAHVNGLRFSSIRGDKVDILYNNIKTAFFQPCDGEMTIALHFRLKNAILIGKKKQEDIQFYTEVGEIVTDLGKQHHMHDRDDLQAEQMERELRSKLKAAFKSFCEKVEALTKQKVDFELPFRELGFHGAPFRSTVLLQPTSNAIINLIEWPVFIIHLDEIELIHFERVSFQLKNFDMVFVFKDYYRKPSMITSIPMQSLDGVKEWLNSCDIYYTEGIQSLNWTKVMKTITDDPEGFFESGGWSFLKPESDDEGRGDESESEDSYNPSGSEEGEEESETESDDMTEYSESESGSAASGLSSDESEGKDWDELEKEAAKADKETGEYDMEERPRSKPQKRGHKDHHRSDRSDRARGDRSDRARGDRSDRSESKSPSKKKKHGHHSSSPDKKRRKK